MSRPLIAYFSPLKPTRSGIADYSERLLPELVKHFDIHLYGHDKPPESPEIKNSFHWFPRRDYELQIRKTPYDLNVYQIGNSHEHQFIYPIMARYPGTVILHDANIHHARAYSHLGHRNLGDYLDELKWCHGVEGEKIGPALAHGFHSPEFYDRFPMLKIVCKNARSIIVHNSFSKTRVNQFLDSNRIFQVPLPYFDVDLPDRIQARKTLGINDNETVIASFGFVTPGKGVDSILKAYRLYQKQNTNSRCVLVGVCLDDSFGDWLKTSMAQMSNVYLTGYVDDVTFRTWLSASDICISLRYPTQGESSDALLRIMGAQKPVIVPDYRQFREIPSDACVHIPVHPNESYALLIALRMLTDDLELAKDLALRARNHVISNNSGYIWIRSFVAAIEQTLMFRKTEPLAKTCSLRHVRVPPVEETVVHCLQNWGDLALRDELINPIANAMEELGLDE
ncbi:glycosyltransferase [bacterium]|nr:glycosyltransferase [bacterium]